MPSLAALAATTLLCACRLATAAPADLGINPDALHFGHVAIGFIPGWGEPLAPSTPSSINALLPAPMAVVGAYAQINTSDPRMTQLDTLVNQTLAQPGKPILQLALMPNEGLASVTPAVASWIADKMAAINARGLTVWLRYAHEMNGDWYVWGRQDQAFIASWRLLTNAIRAKAPTTYMNWSPNSMLDTSVDDKKGYTMYWPGAQYVDLVGLSWYHFGGQYRSNVLPDPGQAIGMMKQFDDIYGPGGYNLPFILSETGASYTTIIQTGQPESGGASEIDIKKEWFRQLTSCQMLRDLPNLKAITWFDVLKDENAAGNTEVKREDFRIIGNAAKPALIKSTQNILGSTMWSGALSILASRSQNSSACTA